MIFTQMSVLDDSSIELWSWKSLFVLKASSSFFDSANNLPCFLVLLFCYWALNSITFIFLNFMRFCLGLWDSLWLSWCTGLLRPDIMRLRQRNFYPQGLLSQPVNHGSVFMVQAQLKAGSWLRQTAPMPVMNMQLNGRNVSIGKSPLFWPMIRQVHWLPRLTADEISDQSHRFSQLMRNSVCMRLVEASFGLYVASMLHALDRWFALLLNLFCSRRRLVSQFKCDLDNRCSFRFSDMSKMQVGTGIRIGELSGWQLLDP